MDVLYRDTRKLLVEARNLLETLESASCNHQLDPAASSPVLHTFTQTLTSLTSNARTLRTQLGNEPPSRRQVWKAKLRDLDDQLTELRAGQQRCQSKLRGIERANEMRRDLLEQGGGHTAIRLMGEADEGRRLDHSASLAGGILETGRDTFSRLVDQRGRLRGARKKVLDVLHQVGLDQRLVKRIERRDRADLILVYSLMVALLLCLAIAVAFKYYRKNHS